jgi:dihydropteroate synthase
MGVLNVTPDSFSDGGLYMDPEDAARCAAGMEAAGAGIIDVGGESTRPGALPVGAAEELRRVVPVIEAIRARSGIPISIDTSKAVVARAAIRAGADVINDITALRGDPDMAGTALETGAGLVLMHMRGTPRTMQKNPHYEDPVAEVGKFLRHHFEQAVEYGMRPDSIALDPGIGFGKKPAHNRALLLAGATLSTAGRPLLVGVSHKSFLSWAADAPAIPDRHWPGVALTSFCREHGAKIFRVHDPAPHVQALRMTEAILDARPAATNDA